MSEKRQEMSYLATDRGLFGGFYLFPRSFFHDITHLPLNLIKRGG